VSVERPKTGVKRRVVFRAWFHRRGHIEAWQGPERDYKSDAEYDRAIHETNAHGGAPRGETAE